MSQRQDSTTDQLASIREAAVAAGLTEAVEWLDYRSSRITWITNEEIRKICRRLGCYDAEDILISRWKMLT